MLRLVTGEVGPVPLHDPIACRRAELRALSGFVDSIDRENPRTGVLETVDIKAAKCVRVGPFELALAP